MVYYGSQGLPQPNPFWKPLESIVVLILWSLPRRGCWWRAVEILEESNAWRDHKPFRNGTRVRTNLPTQSAQKEKGRHSPSLDESCFTDCATDPLMIPLGGCQRICGMDTLRRRGCPGRAWFPCRAWTELLFGGSIYEVNMDGSVSLDHFFLMVEADEVGPSKNPSTPIQVCLKMGDTPNHPKIHWVTRNMAPRLGYANSRGSLALGSWSLGWHPYLFSGLFLSVCVGKAPFFFGPVGKPTPRCSIHPWNTRDDRWETGMDRDGIDSA